MASPVVGCRNAQSVWMDAPADHGLLGDLGGHEHASPTAWPGVSLIAAKMELFDFLEAFYNERRRLCLPQTRFSRRP